MGRTRVKNKKTNVASPSERETPSTEALFAKAQSLLTQCDYDLAQKFALRILQREPSNADARELLGVTQIEKGQLDEAKETFQTLLPPAPDAPNPPPPSAHLYLAQLSEEDPHLALRHYEAAVGILHGQLKGKERASGNDNAGETELDIRKNIVRVLIAMVEIWMAPTYDLCFDPKAEETCDALLKTAFEADPDNVEALICLSSFRLSQQRPEEAKEAAMKAWTSFKDEEDDSKLPPIPTRIELAKRFIELSEFPPALVVLQSIMASDDQEVEAWYLEGWCFFLMAERAKESGSKLEDLQWEGLARDARECLENCRTLHVSFEHPDDKLLEHTVELIRQLDSLGIKPMSPDEDDGAEDGWEDIEESGDDVEMS